jgi:hypothetical protein
VSPLERMPGKGATHQLLSGQLAWRPTPKLSYLCDGGDRGLRVTMVQGASWSVLIPSHLDETGHLDES